MLNLQDMVANEIRNGYGNLIAQAKVCQDIILLAIAEGNLNHNITVKGGVVMQYRTCNIRRSTQDLDIDFLHYPLTGESIDLFVEKLNCIDGLNIKRIGKIEELKQQDYKGKRLVVEITDVFGFALSIKIDLGVHNKLDILQEDFFFDMGFAEGVVKLLVNSNEQIFAEKIRSLLRFGFLSTRFKDIFDLYYLREHVNQEKLKHCLDLYVCSDINMREKSIEDISKRVGQVFSNKSYLKRLSTSDKNWIQEDVSVVTSGIMQFLDGLS